MEAADGSNDSRVIVECTDPYGLFDQVAPLLQARLPIGNLHWKSKTRPARSIEELEVLLKKEEPRNGERPLSVRRHQIPGLRQSPYVRVLLVRCDDRDSYRSSVRKSTKDWVKSLEISTSGKTVVKGQERHDAYEYLILHVVLPNTPAAAQLKSSKNIPAEAFESNDSIDNKSKWTGKSPSTVYDKLRADFHSTSKAPFERVAQIRLNAPGRPSSALSPAELEGQWQDLIEKLKSAILQSFDARVAQYEEDIREREGQRHLPGWNFCTYFILKEGLARGFENVGLLQDALALYEELDLELDLVVQDHVNLPDSSNASALLPYSSALKRVIREALSDGTATNGTSDGSRSSNGPEHWLAMEAGNLPWKLDREDYQAMILTNQISVLDFRTYMFIRKSQILLRKANMVETTDRGRMVHKRSGSKWDAEVLCDICERSITFMHTSARALRQDLVSAWGGYEGSSDAQNKDQHVIINNILASWKWSATLQILSDCQVMSVLTGSNKPGWSNNGQHGSVNKDDQRQPSREHHHSLSAATSSSQTSTGTKLSHEDDADGFFTGIRIAKGRKEDLIFWSAELLYILSKILVQICTNESSNFTAQVPQAHRAMRDSEMILSAGKPALSGILSPSLRSCLVDTNALIAAWRILSHRAYQCYQMSSRVRICKPLADNLARLDSAKGDHVAAARWFDQIASMSQTTPQVQSDIDALELYANCLQATSRYFDAVSALALVLRAPKRLLARSDTVSKVWHTLLDVAAHLDSVEVAWDSLLIFDGVDRYISFEEGRSGFDLAIRLRTSCSLIVSMPGCIRLTLQNVQSSMPATIELVFRGQVELSEISSNILLSSSICTQGWFEMVSISVELGHLRLQHDLRAKKQEPLFSDDDKVNHPEAVAADDRSILVYPSDTAPWIDASHVPTVDLAKRRSICVEISWYSTCEEVRLRIKPSTAGCRLDLQATTLGLDTIEQCETELSESGQVILIGNATEKASTILSIPYSVDHAAIPTISIRTEMTYQRAGCEYKSFQDHSILVALPLSVNVQDTYQDGVSFSTFSFSPSFVAPVIIHRCETVDGKDVKIDAPSRWSHPVEVYTRSTATWPVRVTRRKHDIAGSDRFLLTVVYSCMDEAVEQSISKRFRQDIEHSEFSFAIRPLVRHLITCMHSLLTEQVLESATLLQETATFSFEVLKWDDVLHGVPPSCRQGLGQWLREWHRNNESIMVETEVAIVRRLTLHVDVPLPQVVITAALQPQKDVFFLGEPMPAKLTIATVCGSQERFDVTVEVLDQTATWTIGGARKITLATHEGEVTETVYLVAHRLGSLLLPAIDIRCVNAAQRKDQVKFEVDNRTGSTSVFVRSGVASTTLALGGDEGSNNRWVINCDHKHAAD